MKLRAFTLVELIVAMIITSVIIYFSYLYLDSSTKFFNLYKGSRTSISNSISLISLLSLEYDQSDSELVNADDQTLLFTGKDVSYLFSNSKVTRKTAELTDSFKTGEVHFEAVDDSKLSGSTVENLVKVTFNDVDYPLAFSKQKTVIEILNENDSLKLIRNGRH